MGEEDAVPFDTLYLLAMGMYLQRVESKTQCNI